MEFQVVCPCSTSQRVCALLCSSSTVRLWACDLERAWGPDGRKLGMAPTESEQSQDHCKLSTGTSQERLALSREKPHRSATMGTDQSPHPDETLPAHPVSSATSEQPVAEHAASGGASRPTSPPSPPPDVATAASKAGQAHWPTVRRLLSNRKRAWIVSVALICSVIGLSVGLVASSSATATPSTSTPVQSAPGSGSTGGIGSGGGGSNARSGPAAGEHPAPSATPPRRASH